MAEHRRNGDRDVLKDRLSAIKRAMHLSDQPTKKFICFEDIKDIWCDTTRIKAIIPALEDSQIKTVKDKLPKLLSFLVLYMQIRWFDEKFVSLIFGNNGSLAYDDESMPLCKEILEGPFEMQETVAELAHLDQYSFLPIDIDFSAEKDDIQIIDETKRLPFIKKPGERFIGGFGEVQCYEVAQKNGDGNSAGRRSHSVAVKKFHLIDHGRKEVENMQFLKQSLTRNRNISLHIAIFQVGNTEERIIVSPQAEYGTLETFFQASSPGLDVSFSATTSSSYDPPTNNVYDPSVEFPVTMNTDANLADALKSQVAALCEALRFLHEGFLTSDSFTVCAHMDLKPDNILIFHGGVVGLWKLCDFGISTIDNNWRREKIGSIGDYWYTLDAKACKVPSEYTAPEIHHSLLHLETSTGRSGDMWSFGCLFAEVLAYSMSPENGVHDFRSQRTQNENSVRHRRFYSIVQPSDTSTLEIPLMGRGQRQPKGDYEVSEKVEQWFNDHQNSQQWAAHWIDCIRRCLVIEPGMRTSAKTLISLILNVAPFPIASRPSPGRNSRPEGPQQGAQRTRDAISSTPGTTVGPNISHRSAEPTSPVASIIHTTSETRTNEYGADVDGDVPSINGADMDDDVPSINGFDVDGDILSINGVDVDGDVPFINGADMDSDVLSINASAPSFHVQTRGGSQLSHASPSGPLTLADVERQHTPLNHDPLLSPDTRGTVRDAVEDPGAQEHWDPEDQTEPTHHLSEQIPEGGHDPVLLLGPESMAPRNLVELGGRELSGPEEQIEQTHYLQEQIPEGRNAVQPPGPESIAPENIEDAAEPEHSVLEESMEQIHDLPEPIAESQDAVSPSIPESITPGTHQEPVEPSHSGHGLIVSVLNFPRPEPHPLLDASRWKPIPYEFDLTAKEDAISVAFDNARIVVLTKSSLQSFHISNISNSEAPGNLLPRNDHTCWTHVTIAGQRILLVGKDEDSEACRYHLFSYITDTWQLQPPTNPSLPPLPHRDPKMIALSKGGLLAVALQNRIQVRSLSQPNGFTQLMIPSELSRISIVDIRFNLPNDDRDILYVWAIDNGKGLLLIYELFEAVYAEEPHPMHRASFRLHSDEDYSRNETYILPLNNYHGCVIAFSNRRFFPYALYCNVTDRNDEKVTMNFDYAYIREDNSLVAAVKSIWSKEIKQYSLIFEESSIRLGGPETLLHFKSVDRGMIHGARVMLQPGRVDTFLVYKNGRSLRGGYFSRANDNQR